MGDRKPDLGRARLAQRPDLAARRGAAHDGIVHHHHPFARDDFLDDRQFQAHLHLAHFLLGRDERATDVVAADEAHIEWDAALLGIADRRGGAGIGHRDHHVSLDGMFPGELAAQLPALVHVLPGTSCNGKMKAETEKNGELG